LIYLLANFQLTGTSEDTMSNHQRFIEGAQKLRLVAVGILSTFLIAAGLFVAFDVPHANALPQDSVCKVVGSGSINTRKDGPVSGPNAGTFSGPGAVAIDSAGKMYVSDNEAGVSEIRVVDNGQISTIDILPAPNLITELVIDRARNVMYGAGYRYVWRWDIGSPQKAKIIAGLPSTTSEPVVAGGPAISSHLGFYILSIALTPQGHLLIGDLPSAASGGPQPGGRIFRIDNAWDPALDNTRVLQLVAGNGTFGAPQGDVAATNSPMYGGNHIIVLADESIVYRSEGTLMYIPAGLPGGTQRLLNQSELSTPESVDSGAPLASVNLVSRSLLSDPSRGVFYSYAGYSGRFQVMSLIAPPSGFKVDAYAGTGADGYVDGPAATAEFAINDVNHPATLGPDGAIYVADYGNRRIRRIDPTTRDVTTVAGVGNSAKQLTGDGATLDLDGMLAMTRDRSNGDTYFTTKYHRVYRMTPGGNISLFGGSGKARWVSRNLTSGSATAIDIGVPGDIAISPTTRDVFVLSWQSQTVVRIQQTGEATPLNIGGLLVQADTITIGDDGALYVTNRAEKTVRRVTLNPGNGAISSDEVILGNAGGVRISDSETPAVSTNVGEVWRVAVDRNNNIFFAGDNGIGRYHAATQTVSRIAGSYVAGPDPGGTAAQLFGPDVKAKDIKTGPIQIAVDLYGPANGDLYWTDSYGVIRLSPEGDPAQRTSESYREALARFITSKTNTNGLSDYRNGGNAQDAAFRSPIDLFVGPDQEVFVLDANAPHTGGGVDQIRVVATNGCARVRAAQTGPVPQSIGSGLRLDEVPASALPIGFPGYGAGDLGDSSLNGTNVDSSPIANSPIANSPIANSPIANSPIANSPIANSPIANSPIANSPLVNPPGGWAALLVGTSLAGVPLQNITLRQVFTTPDVKPKVASVTFADIDLANSPLASLSLSSVALGNIPIKNIKLPTPPVNAFDGWCAEVLSSTGRSCLDLAITPDSTVFELDVKSVPIANSPIANSALKDIPIANSPIANSPIANSPIANSPIANSRLVDFDLAIAPIANSPIANSPIANSPIANSVIDCAKFNCTTASNATLRDAFNAGAILPNATLGQVISYVNAVTTPRQFTLADLVVGIPDYVTWGDFLLLLVRRADLPWESVPLDNLVSSPFITGTNPDPSTLATLSASFDADITGPNVPMTVAFELPAGFAYLDDSFVGATGLPLVGDPVILPATPTTNAQVQLRFDKPTVKARYTVSIQARTGIIVGDTKTKVRVSPTVANGEESIGEATVVVTDGTEPNNSIVANTALPILAPDTLVTGAFPAGDPVDFYQVNAKGPKGTRNTFYLSHLPQDADIVIYEPGVALPLRNGALRVGQSAPLSQPVDPQVRTTGTVIDPQVAQDIAADAAGYRVVGYSAKRGTANETVEVLSSGIPGPYIVQVRPYNSQPSNSPYLLRLKQVIPPGIASCIAAPSGPGGGVVGSTASVAGKTSVILVNRQRLGNLYGAAQVEGPNGVIARLDALAASTNAAVVSVDANNQVSNAYSAWDSAPCDVDGANGVVRAINAYVDELFPAGPSRDALKSITIVGGDDQIPMGRVPDDTKYSNELEYAQDLLAADGKSTPLSSATANQNTLSDDPYAAFNLRTYGQRILYSPDVAIGRLVETPTEILKMVNTYLAPAPGLAAGEIDPQTSVVTGYDFLSDGAAAVKDGLAPRVPTQAELINDTWARPDLNSQLFPAAGTSPAVASINAHFSHNEALPASGNTTGDTSDLFTTNDVADPAHADKLARRIILSMGCHAGTNVPDVYVGASPRKLDWAQAFAQQGAVFVSNTGFGYGDTELVAYSEKLQRELAKRLRNGATIADALRFAKQSYLADGLTSVYDPKVLMQTVFYGLPYMRLAGTFVPEVPPVAPVLGTDPKTGLLASELSVDAPPTLVTTGPFYVVNGQDPLTADGRPVQPRTDVDITQAGNIAHGALITGLTSNDVPNFAVKFSRPMVDLAANEPVTVGRDVAWPSFLQNVTSFKAANNAGVSVDRQQLVLATGQWFSTSTVNPRVGTQRLFTNVKAKVFYRDAADTDFTAPTINRSVTTKTASGVTFSVDTTDPINGVAGIKRVLVLYLDGNAWRALDLTPAAGAGTYEASTPSATAAIDYFVQVVDASGNVAVSSNKAALFNAPSTGGGTPVVVVEPPIVPIPNNPPTVSAITITQTATGGSTSVTASGSFSDADSAAWTASINWGDGSSASPVTLNADKTFSVTKVFTTSGTFNYTGEVAVTDEKNAVGKSTFAYTVNVAPANVAPVIGDLTVTPSQSGGSVSVALSGSFTDPDSASWTGTVEWGDGSAAVPLTISGLSFSANKSFPAAGSYTATVKIVDNEGASSTKTVAVVVPQVNQAPVVTAATATTAAAGNVINVSLSGAFTDTDSSSWTGTVNWGDGGPLQPLTINNAAKTLSAQTTSFTAGTKTGTVTLCDNANACGTKTFTYRVGTPNRSRLTPYIDCFTENRNASNQIVSLTVKFGYNNPNPYPVTVPLGSLNTFIPTPVNRGQPTVFNPGRQRQAFSVTMGANSAATWILDGRLIKFSRNFSRC
jgi:hypothetical protein